jgi:hypothetical protein
MTSEKLAVIADLRERDHRIVSAKYAKGVAGHFGFVPKLDIIQADPPGAFKGATLKDDAQFVQGVGADDLARQICHHLGVDYDYDGGRGSTLRSCCDSLTAYLS